MLGGGLEVDSELGKGCTFTLRIPTGEIEGVALRDTAPAPVPELATGDKKKACPSKIDTRILVVDDNAVNRKLVSSILGKFGATVHCVNNGQLAVDEMTRPLASEETYDLVLMDIQMPVLDGLSATRKLRMLGFDLPIIALTANTMSGDRDKCLAAGCSDFASKPIDRSALLAAIESHIRTSKAPA